MTTSPDSGLLKPGQIPREAAKSHCVPRHVAIIMDGNGRWASARGLARTEGHRQGLDALRGMIRHAGKRGIEYVTVYSFSSENWSRPPTEVSFLMGLLRRFVQRDLSELHQANIRVRVIGARTGLEPGICALLEEAEALTRSNTGMTLVVAFNYGGRDEIVRAVRRLVDEAASGRIDLSSLSEGDIASHLDTSDIPDPDLIIRTSGEQRLSNFLLWQAAYAEFVFSPVFWPDFDSAAFDAALEAFAARERRFGAVSAGGS